MSTLARLKAGVGSATTGTVSFGYQTESIIGGKNRYGSCVVTGLVVREYCYRFAATAVVKYKFALGRWYRQ